MNERLDLAKQLYIKQHTELGQKSPEIAEALNISVWTVRKYVRRIKKGNVCHLNKVALQSYPTELREKISELRQNNPGWGAISILVELEHVQPKTIHYLWALRLAFEQFGLPKAIQVDKDSVFIDNTSRSAFPSLIQLFLLGLGIDLSFITVPPPAKQAMVERSHQTLDKQVLKGKIYKSWHELFINTNKRRGILNEKYPCRTLGKRAPMKVYPEAIHSRRPYSIEKETKLLDLNRIEKSLAHYTWYRKISKVKTLSLKKIYYLKGAKPETYVQIKFCATSKKMIFRDVNEQIIEELDTKDFAKSLLKLKTTQALLSMKKKIFKNKNFPLE